ncbi:hypothetical protein [Streptomyces avidinii]|uniref:PAS domain-containing protein n=1 Tax=Streptomyces avidinii TaxID=1895 RepID=A0ABS4L3F2_STRAV|nr:hypothetical protein [Streptomyces avidinii]MBP2036384.1 hypothetical protein [Streptomyces avidinii]GGY81986.1 hypothetical protein GCM10010343_03350 [Streptomyces avidinii]
MNNINTETLGWNLIGWDSDGQASHITGLNRVEILRIRDLFPGRDDDFLETAVHEVPPALYSAMQSAIPHLEFREGLEYQIGGFLLSV